MAPMHNMLMEELKEGGKREILVARPSQGS
jgi:hypothetical protein